MAGVWSTLQGHLWTVGPHLSGRWRRPRNDGVPFSTSVDDPELGPIAIGGRLFDRGAADALLLVVHGLGGSSRSAYVARALAAAEEAALACAVVDLRGADLRGEDVYHAGLCSDLAALIDCSALARYRRVYVLGYSLGGHLALGLGIAGTTPRLAALAAVCAPLDLDRSAAAFDRRRCWLYRQHVLGALKASYRAVARRRGVLLPPVKLAEIRTIREWDARVVVPRFGFAGVGDYYTRASVGPRLGRLRVPSLYVAALNDPMVPFETVSALLEPRHPELEVRRLGSGGHVGFPASADLGLSGGPGLERQVVAWLLARR